MGPLLRATGLSIHTPAGKTLVDHIDLDVAEGEKVALIGASGSGKSLLATALAGATAPTLQATGVVEFSGQIRTTPAVGIRDLVLVRQDSADALNPLVKVGTQLAFPLKAQGETTATRREEIAIDLLASIGMDDPHRILASYPGQLSGGQRQRVCIALGLACQPRLLITDECTTALDLISQARVLEALQPIGTLVFITHDLSVAAQLCDRVVVMAQGRIVEDTTVQKLFDEPVHPASRMLSEQARKTLESVA